MVWKSIVCVMLGGLIHAMDGTGPFATIAKVAVEDDNGPVKLKREEQIAIMFLAAIQRIEGNCQREAGHACTLDQLLTGPVGEDGSHLDKLKFDPKVDPNYTYTLEASGKDWEAHANGKKPGFIGFCYRSGSSGFTTATYNASGKAKATDKELTNRSIQGDSFTTR
jgi:hypothetical protein